GVFRRRIEAGLPGGDGSTKETYILHNQRRAQSWGCRAWEGNRMSARRVFRRINSAGLTLCGAGMLFTAMLGVASASPARADPSATWRVTFSSNTTLPSTGLGFGFRGSCAYGGGVDVTQGDAGRCEVAAYIHSSAGPSFTCHMSQT